MSSVIRNHIRTKLSPREIEVLELIVGPTCSTNEETAAALGLSARTVEIYRGRIMSKLNAKNVVHLVRMVYLKPDRSA